MNRIDKKFQELKRKRKKAFIAFITAGDPNLKSTEQLVLAFEKAGVDIVEIGVPFSDPLADGPTIQAASQRALQKDVNLDQILNLVGRIRKSSQIPIALMTYYNPIFFYNEGRFLSKAKACGVDGIIVPDLPPEEARDLIRLAKRQDISTVFFVSPTTTAKRMKLVAQASSGFIYYVSLTGVTGSRSKLPSSISGQIKLLKRITKKPVCVGFGISTPQQARAVAKFSDGVIVGSAIVSAIERNRGKRDLVKKVVKFVSNLAK